MIEFQIKKSTKNFVYIQTSQHQNLMKIRNTPTIIQILKTSIESKWIFSLFFE